MPVPPSSSQPDLQTLHLAPFTFAIAFAYRAGDVHFKRRFGELEVVGPQRASISDPKYSFYEMVQRSLEWVI
jgi:hypothetical protein